MNFCKKLFNCLNDEEDSEEFVRYSSESESETDMSRDVVYRNVVYRVYREETSPLIVNEQKSYYIDRLNDLKSEEILSN